MGLTALRPKHSFLLPHVHLSSSHLKPSSIVLSPRALVESLIIPAGLTQALLGRSVASPQPPPGRTTPALSLSPQQRCCSPPRTLPASFRPPKVSLSVSASVQRARLDKEASIGPKPACLKAVPPGDTISPSTYFYSNSGKTYCCSVFPWLGPIPAPGRPLQAHCCAAPHQPCLC